MDQPLGSVEHTYRRYFALIRAKCRRVLGDQGEAEDVAQETFMRLWRNRDAIEPSARSVSAWIYRTATHLAIDRLRARRLALPTLVDVDSETPEDLLATRRMLARVAAQLPADELEVAILSRIDGLSQREIAEVVGSSERTVRRVMQRVDERLSALAEAAS